jgi:photosystem II stability/assembly factor-like uncharacterized protein
VTGASGPGREEGFGAFFGRYTRTWQHALATAALTAFGTLTFVHRLFAVVAILAYALPPVVLYLRGPSPTAGGTVGGDREAEGTGSERSRTRTGRREPDSGPGDGPRGDGSTGREEAGIDGTAEAADDDRPGPGRTWEPATVPVGEALLDAAVDGADAYAVGAEGAVLADGGDGWVLVVPDGPGAGSNALRGVDAVEDGGVWFAGDGGAVGRLDPGGRGHADHSAPDGDTTNVVDVAATATRDGETETVLLVDGSGRVRRGEHREGAVRWDEPVTPGSGSSLAGVATCGDRTGYVCDTNGGVFETADGGRSFEATGPDSVEGTFTGVAAAAPDECVVSDDAGVVHRFDGTTWTPERVGDDPVLAVTVDGGHGLATGDDGTVYERPVDGPRWERVPTPAGVPLRGVDATPGRAVAVGDDGTVLERTSEPDGT